MKDEEYYGWDIYDTLNSNYIYNLPNPYLQLIAIQINKFSPINFRPILGIKKGIDLKGISLFSQAYAKLYRLSKNDLYKNELKKTLSIICANSLNGKYGHHCWSSHYFPFISADKHELRKDNPDIIGTSQAIIALIEGFNVLGDNYLKETAFNAIDFILNNFKIKSYNNYFLKYTLNEKDRIVFNATAQGLEAFSCLLQLKNDTDLKDISNNFADSLISIQSKDGSWPYSIYKSSQFRKQLDFHQGYILDGLLSFLPFYKDQSILLSCLNKGIEFYKNYQFYNDSIALYRYPRRYPIDIHNQAQGIITFSKFSDLNSTHIVTAKKIADWTISNMQGPNGYFFLHRWPFLDNKIPYMRWGQAWMMLAISSLIEKLNNIAYY